MIRTDGAFELGAKGASPAHPQVLWAVAAGLVTVFYGANLWVHSLYLSPEVFHSLVLGGPFAQSVDVWRPFTAFFFEPCTAGYLATLVGLVTVVRELEAERGPHWLVILWLMTALATIAGYMLGDRLLLGRDQAASFGMVSFLVVACLVYARDHADRDVYPFSFLQMKGRNLALMVAIMVVAAFDFRTLPFWTLGEHHVSISVCGPIAGILGGVLGLMGVPVVTRKLALRRALGLLRREQADVERREVVDLLLAKVAKEGLEGLTRRERRLLEQSSRDLRGGALAADAARPKEPGAGERGPA